MTLGDHHPFPQMWEERRSPLPPTGPGHSLWGRGPTRGGQAAGRPVAEWDSVSSSCDAIHGGCPTEGPE